MREKPNVDDHKLITCLRDRWGIEAASVEFMPIGYDAYAATYRVRANDHREYFLKLRLDAVNPPSVIIPRFLMEHGLTQVPAPIPATGGDLWVSLETFALILYPYIDGHNAMKTGLTDA